MFRIGSYSSLNRYIMKKLVKENINFDRGQDPKEVMGIGRGLYGVLETDYDQTTLNFFYVEKDARSEFENIKSGVLFKVNGEGRLYLSMVAGSDGEVDIVDEKDREP